MTTGKVINPCLICETTKGSSNGVRTRGLCRACYEKLRREGRLPEFERERFDARTLFRLLMQGKIEEEVSGCILWPGGVDLDGYPIFHVNQTPKRLSHLVLEANGNPRPSIKYEALHAPHDVCGSRRCVAIAHLRWGTKSDNMKDQVKDGTRISGERHPMAKFTERDITEIRRRGLNNGNTYTSLAKEYKVSRHAIASIIKRKTWSHVQVDQEVDK